MAGYDYSYGAPPPGPAGPYAATYGAPPPHGAPPPYHGAPAYQQPPVGGPFSTDEVRTVFITGFPDDVKERELNNLLRFLPGYEASQMNFKNGQAQGFGLFATAGHARAAIDALHHQVFDTENSVLRCEMARKNMYIRDEPTIKRPRFGAAPPAAPAAYPPPGAPGAPGGPGAFPPAGGKGDNPPCNTLFVGNLSDNINETELENFFAALPGYKQMRINRGPKAVTAFVEFDSVEAALDVHTNNQNVTLTSNDRGALRIQFSKSPLGSRKRDANGAPVPY